MIKEFERNLKEKGRSVSMAKKQQDYGNESITMLKGPDKVRKRPGVIFGSDGLDGCEHSVFEVISNSIDEARSGYGNKIVVTKYNDNTIEVEDFGRGCLLTIINQRNALTGSLFTANCMPEASMTTAQICMSILWDLTVWDFVLLSFHLNLWTLK